MAESRSRESEPRAAPVKTTSDARQGVTLGIMRYVLAISVVLAIIAMVLAYIFI
jgi:hypothetical protein